MSSSSKPSAGFSTADVRSGFLVFLIALPLCLGIAMASGFPPVGGVITAIVGGLLVSFLGSSPLTIKGPAAGLIVIAIGAVTELGEGDPMTGYRRALAVGVVAAGVQIVFAFVRAATVGALMAPSVVHGMLAAIGVIIIAKQSHLVVGVTPEGKKPFELLAEIPQSVMHANPEILAIGGLSLLILFGWPKLRAAWTKQVPAPMVVLLTTVPLGLFFDLDHTHTYGFMAAKYEVGPNFLVQLPGSILDAVSFPDFSVVFSAASLKYVVMFALIGTIESTLSVLAVDSMDPEKRASRLNRDLLATGIGNLIAASIGGLPMISEIVRSRANIDAGAKSQWSNFSHGAFLLFFVAFLPGLLQEIPLAALAAMLVYTGARLASPTEFAHARELGLDQLSLFVTTLLVTLATDLLIGVAVGLVLKIGLHMYRGASLTSLFRARVEKEVVGSEVHLRIEGAATFGCLMAVRHELRSIPPETGRVVVKLSNAPLVDHTFLSRMHAMADEWPDTELELRGLDEMEAASPHPFASRRKTV